MTDRLAIARAVHELNAGNEHEDRGELECALRRYEAAVAIAPRYARAHLNVGNALWRLHRYEAAEAAFRLALRLAPDYAHAHFNLGAMFAERGETAPARTALADAVRIDPGMAEKALDVESYLLFSSSFRVIQDAELAANDHRRVGTDISKLASPPFMDWANEPDGFRQLRIGYVSGDFGQHPVSLFMRPVLRNHDNDRYQIYCYLNQDNWDEGSTVIVSTAHARRNIRHATDSDVAALIRADQIDILVDLAGHTQNNRLAVFAKHPAPVQVTWLGYLNTTGLPQMDYRICDRYTDPVGATERLHTERLYRMPHSQWCYEPWCDVPPVDKPHADAPDRVVFGSCNQSLKLSDYCVGLWCSILSSVPDAGVDILDVRDARAGSAIVAKFARHGIDTERLTLKGRTTLPNYYRTIGHFDIALDTFPHNGATTTLDTLWMGVPVVGLRGPRGISRLTVSILSTLGVRELIAETESEYVELNIRLASDAAWRQSLRETLRSRLATSPLMDARGFVSALEGGYRHMWIEWCTSKRSNRRLR